jgi:hypothetical protein
LLDGYCCFVRSDTWQLNVNEWHLGFDSSGEAGCVKKDQVMGKVFAKEEAFHFVEAEVA